VRQISINSLEKYAASGRDIKWAQQLRLRRFLMALLTYGIVILTIILTNFLGVGKLNALQWIMILGIALFGNVLIFILFHTDLNLRFSDPSLTCLQIIFSGFWGMFILHAMPEIRSIVLMFYLLAFNFGILRLTRRQYLKVVGCVMGMYAILLGIEFIQQGPDFKTEYEIFLFFLFGLVLTWIAFFGGFVSNLRQRLRIRNKELQEIHENLKTEIEERKQAQAEKDDLIGDLQKALEKVKTLSGLLPICASCKNVRDDKGYWTRIERYITDRSDAEFSHGICPECSKKLYPDLKLD